MGSFRPSNRGGFGGRSDRSDGRSNSRFGGRSRDRDFESSERRGPPQMHEITCDKCGKQSEVPFMPKGDKPVYCSDCFRKNDNPRNDSPRSQERSFESRSSNGSDSAEQLKKINAKLDKILSILETEDTPKEE